MAYATLQNLKDWVGQVSGSDPGAFDQLTDRVGEPSVAVEANGQELLDRAESIVNSRLAIKYAVPIDTAGDAQAAAFLRSLTLNLAAQYLWASHPLREDVPERVQTLYDEAMDLLGQIAAGDAAVPSVGVLASPTAISGGQYSGDDRVLTSATRGLL